MMRVLVCGNERTSPLRSEDAERRRTPETRPYDAEKSLADILEVATAEFADKGLSGARDRRDRRARRARASG